MRSARSLLGSCLAALLLLTGFVAAPASAAPGAYRVLIVDQECESPVTLRDGIAAFPDVAAVDLFEACAVVPTVAQLSGYDLVVSTSNNYYPDQVAYGNALADFVDAGGVVVQYAYDNWQGNDPGGGSGPTGPTGRFVSGGYPPFLPGPNPNLSLTLGAFDASSPLMQGVSTLVSESNTAPQLAPGATLVAKWSNESNLIAVKGRVVSVSAYMAENAWSGDFPRLTVNAVRALGPQRLRVENFTPGGGSVASATGPLPCEVGGFFCTVHYPRGTTVSVVATPTKGFAFSGFGFDCAGPACSVTMDAAKTVSVNFVRFAPLGTLKRNWQRGTATMTVRVGSAGVLTATSKRAKRQRREVAAAANLKIPVVAKGKAAKRLRKTGRAKVRVKVSFLPNGGQTATFSRTVLLLRDR